MTLPPADEIRFGLATLALFAAVIAASIAQLAAHAPLTP